MAANIFTGAINSDWNTAGNWSLLAVPTATDGNVATFDVTSPNVVVSGANRFCNAIDFTGYTNTFDNQFNLFVSGNVTLSATMTDIGTGTFYVNSTGNITSNGYVWQARFFFSATNGPTTLIDDLTLANCGYGFSTLGRLAGAGRILNVIGNLDISGSQGTANTISKIRLTGAGIFKTASGFLSGSVEIDAGANTVTMQALTLAGTTLTYVSGVLDTTACVFSLGGNFLTLVNFSAFTFSDVVFRSSGTLNCTNDIRVNNVTWGVIGTATLNGPGTLYVTTTLNESTGVLQGTGSIILDGTITWSGSGTIKTNLTIPATSNVTISGTVAFSTGTLTVDPAATVVTTGSTLNINGSCTLDTSSVSWNNVTETSATLITNTSVIHVYGTFTHANGSSTWNGPDVYLYSSITLVNGNIGKGTSKFIYKGSSGVWSATNGLMQANFTIDALSSLAISGAVRYNLGYLYFDPLSSVVSTGSVLTLGTSTISTNGIILNSILVNATSTLTINSKLLATTLTISNASVTFSGLAGFKVNNYILTTPTGNRAISYKNGLEYEVDALFESNGTSTNKYTFTSDSATIKALLTLAYGATQSVKNTNATRIDSSNGQTINASLASVLTDTINWQLTEGNWWLVLNRA